MRKKNSFINRVILYILIFTSLLFLLLVIVWNHSRTILKNNTIDATKRTLSIYINNMENVLENSDRTMRIMMNNIGDILTLGSEEESTRYYASIRLREVLDRCQLNNPDIDTLVIYNGDKNIYLSAESSRVSYKEQLKIEKIIINKTKDKISENYNWKNINIEGNNYISRIYEKDNRILASFIKIDNLLMDIKQTEQQRSNENQQYVLTTTYGKIIGATGDESLNTVADYIESNEEVSYSKDKKIMIITYSFKEEDFRLSCFVDVKDVYGKMQFIQISIIILILVPICFIFAFAHYVNKEIFHPIKELLVAMNRIENGNYDYRINANYKSIEFAKVNTSFNSMVEEIFKLKIETYEEKIQLQEAELRYVHLQIKPHFFLNAMTTIHSMSYQNRNEDIRTYIDALSKNVRYIFSAGLYTVLMKEEITHLENYFKMQELLYPNCVFYYIDIQEEAKTWRVPQLLLHTFIENEFKHAVSVDKLLSIFIRINIEDRDGILMAHITIEDDGPGFPTEIIEKLNSTEESASENGYSIGLWNVKKTLQLLYKRNDLICFLNNEPKGGKVHIWIPYKEVLREKNDEFINSR